MERISSRKSPPTEGTKHPAGLAPAGRAARIGIYTQPLQMNYGGILQTWALQTVLRRRGFEAATFTFDQHFHLPSWRKPYVYAKRLAGKCLGRQRLVFWEEAFNRSYDFGSQHIRPFIEQKIRQRMYRDVREIREDEFGILLAGSDQVWRPRYNARPPQTIGHAFFDFARGWDVKRIAYAASFGTDEWEYMPEQTRECAALAKRFAAISVREKAGIRLCRDHFGLDAVQVPDPTLLLDRADYEVLIQDGDTRAPEGDLLAYILDDSPAGEELIRRVARAGGFEPFRIPIWRGVRDADLAQPSVEQWLRNFRDAKAVVTDSFHACVFSLIFGKPFVVLGNTTRGVSRYESLLGELGLANRLVTTPAGDLGAVDLGGELPTERISRYFTEKRHQADQFWEVLL